ncbi:MAG: DNA polymerase III subunit beta [bacterium]
MKVRLTRDEVAEALTSLQQVVPPKTTLPILSNLLVRAEEGRLHLAATDLDMSITTSVDADVVEEGNTTVPARKFGEIVREFPEEVFQLDEREDRITLTCGKGQFKLTGMDWEEFPKIQDQVEGSRVVVDGERLKRMVNSTSFAVSTDETRPALGGVLWKIQGEDTLMVSTDGHRLAKIELRGAVGGEGGFEGEMIIPPKALNQVTRLISEGKQIEEITVGEKYLQVTAGETRLFSRMIEGPYPNYELVMPKDNDKHILVEAEVLEAAVRRVAILSNTQTHQVKFDLDEGGGLLSAVSPDLGAEAREQVELTYDGGPMAVAYNANYLLEILRHLQGGVVDISLKTPVSAGLVCPKEQEEEEDLTFLLMPLRLND